MTNPHLAPLALQEISSYAGFTHMAIVTADHLTQTATNTAQKLKLGNIPVGAYIRKLEFRLAAAFKNSADAAFNTTTASAGDNGGATTFLTAKELNANGSVITSPQLMNTPTGPYTAADEVDITFNSMTGKKLSDINVGELHVLVEIFNPKGLSDVKRQSAITTK